MTGNMASILIVEDERLLGQTFQASLIDDGHSVHWVQSAEAATAWLENRQVDLALVDVGLPGIDGIEFLRQISQTHPDTTAVLMTAHGDVQTAVTAMKLGAADFLLKPVDLETVSLVAARNIRRRNIDQTLKHEQKRGAQQFGLHQIIGDCPDIEKAKSLVRRLGALDSPSAGPPPHVLITGETGTGKDLIAKAMHFEGPRRDGTFVHVNCAALPGSLVESELFGHVKGAFTQAGTSKRGLFDVADGGTLFLDELSALELPLQAKILVAIETGRIRPVGAVEERTVNVQLVAAMNEDPETMVREGRFREDLYHRLKVIQLHLPPLRERGSDLQMLAEHFVAHHCRKFGMKPKSLSSEARKALRRYHWPGNVRELCHRMESAVLLSDDMIEVDQIPAPKRNGCTTETREDGEVIRVDFSRGPVPLESIEREMIVKALSSADHNLTRAAELLDVSRDTLRYRVEKFGLTAKRTEGTKV